MIVKQVERYLQKNGWEHVRYSSGETPREVGYYKGDKHIPLWQVLTEPAHAFASAAGYDGISLEETLNLLEKSA